MLGVAAGVFLILHGLIHAVVWIPPRPDEPPSGFGSQASWLFAEVRGAVVSVAIVATAGFVLAGVAFLAHQPWWATVAVAAVAASLALVAATFTPWWTAAIVIDLAVAYAAWGPMVDQLTGG